MPLDRLKQVRETNPGSEHEDVHAAGDKPVGKIDRRGVFLERDLPHRRTDERCTPVLFNQPCHLDVTAALQGSNPQALEIGFIRMVRLGFHGLMLMARSG